ncbi:MAG: lactonase family protein [Simkaniaceae bacterium]|nr:lactonase family protein [Simkaniaceae bacterium]MCF7853077.1 lactonase family protein [Simkaniaceae bacterium]
MSSKIIFCLGMTLSFFSFLSSDTSLKLISSHYTPNSILARKSNFYPIVVSRRARYATCTGATWFHGNYLAVLNLFGKKVSVYEFNRDEKTFRCIQEFTNSDGAQFCEPTNLAASPDGKYLAITNSGASPETNLYAIDLKSHKVSPKPIMRIRAGSFVHGVRFSHDGKYLATAGWENKQQVTLYKMDQTGDRVQVKFVDKKAAQFPMMKPKGIIFTRNQRYLIVCYAFCVGHQTNAPENAMVVFRFDSDRGKILEVSDIKKFSGPFYPEDLALIHHDSEIILSNQGNDTITLYSFDPTLGKIGECLQTINGKEAALSFPHGMTVSSDEKYLVVTNFGDDKFNLYEVSDE